MRRALPPVGWHLESISPVPISDMLACCLQDLRAALADDDGLSVREDGGNCETAGALDVHEEAPT